MTSSLFLLILVRTGVVLLVALFACLLTGKVPTFRLAAVRVAVLAVLGLAIASPWVGERARPVIPVAWHPTARTWHLGAAHPIESSPAAVSTSSGDETVDSPEGIRISDCILPLWLIGVGVLAAHLGLGYFSLASLRRRSLRTSADSNDRLNMLLESVAKEAEIRTPPVVVSDRIGAPFVAGSLHPAIFVPTEWADDLDDIDLQAVLRHEVAHIANGDLRWSLLYRLACIVLWPQPFIWMLRSPMYSATEELCDRHVLASGISSFRYADCLLALRENLSKRGFPNVAIGVVERKSTLTRRIEAILDARRSRAVTVSRPVATMTRLGALALATGAAFIFAQPSLALSQGGVSNEEWKVGPYSQSLPVISPEGQPVNHASAWLQLIDETPNPKYRKLQVNGDRIQLPDDNAKDAAATLIVYARGYGLWVKRVWPAKAKVTEVRLVESRSISGSLVPPSGVSPSGIPIRVTMVLHISQPDSSFQVAVLDDLPALDLSTKTDTEGRFTLSNLPADATIGLEVQDDRFAALTYEDRIRIEPNGHSKPKTFELHPAAEMSGRVVRNGQPVPGVYVSAQGTNASNNLGAGSAWTDASGRYTIKRLGAGVYNVALDLRGSLRDETTALAFDSLTIKAGQSLSNLDFNLIPGAVIEGHVFDAEGHPISKTIVGIYGPAHPQTGAWVQDSFTDGEGHYRTRVPAGKQYIYCSDGQYTKDGRFLEVKDGTTNTVDLHVTREK